MPPKKKLALKAADATVSSDVPVVDLNSLPTEVLEYILMMTAVSWANKHDNYEVVLTTLAAVNRHCHHIVRDERFRRQFLSSLFSSDPFQRYMSTGSAKGILLEGARNPDKFITVFGDELFVVCHGSSLINVYNAQDLGPAVRHPKKKLLITRHFDLTSANIRRFFFLQGSGHNQNLYIGVKVQHLYHSEEYDRDVIDFVDSIMRLDVSDGRLLAHWLLDRDCLRTATVSHQTGHVLVQRRSGDNYQLILDYDPNGTLARTIQLQNVSDGVGHLNASLGLQKMYDVGDGTYILVRHENDDFNNVRVFKIKEDGKGMKVEDSIQVRNEVHSFHWVIDDASCIVTINKTKSEKTGLPISPFIEVIDADMKRRRSFKMIGCSNADFFMMPTLDHQRGKLFMTTSKPEVIYIDLWRDDNGQAL